MTWDTTAYQVCLKALGTVEASMFYGAVNPSDVISVGILQWYASRAAHILNLMRTTNAPDWTGVPTSLTNDLVAHPSTDDFWSSRYPSRSEILALNTVMNTAGNILIQDTQAYSDIDAYLAVGARFGLDKDANTETCELWCNVYNRNPSAAGRIIGNCGPTSTLDRLYSYIISDYTEQNYRSRYSQAKTIIVNQDTSGVGAGDPGGGSGGGPGGDPGGNNPGSSEYIIKIGGQLHLFTKSGASTIFQKTGPNYWFSTKDNKPPSGGGGGGGGGTGGGGSPPPTAITDIINWEEANEGAFDYSEGAGRLDPPASGSTDCSGLQYYAFLKYGNIDIGTYTGSQCTTGHLVTTDPAVAKDGSTVLPGDLILYRWENRSPGSDPYDHTALYIGGNQIESHGGPGPGPHKFSHSDNIDAAINNGGIIMVRRHIT